MFQGEEVMKIDMWIVWDKNHKRIMPYNYMKKGEILSGLAIFRGKVRLNRFLRKYKFLKQGSRYEPRQATLEIKELTP